MGRQTNTNTSIVVHGSSTGSALERVRTALEDASGFVLTLPNADTLQVARRRGTIAARTEHCTVRAVQEPQQLVVTVSGTIGGDAVEIIRTALLDRTRSNPTEVDTFRPPTVPADRQAFTPPSDWFVGAGAAASTTVLPSPAPSSTGAAGPSATVTDATILRTGERPAAPAASPRTVVVRVPGVESITLTTVLLLGRDPQPRPTDETETRVIAVADVAMSKTHLAIGPAPDGVWVQDRNSSNGTELVLSAGTQRLQPDTRTSVTVPCAVHAGDTTIEIGWSA